MEWLLSQLGYVRYRSKCDSQSRQEAVVQVAISTRSKGSYSRALSRF